MRCIGLFSALVLAVASLTGCGQSGPKQAPIAAPAEKVAKLPADEVETVEVDVEANPQEEAATESDKPAAGADENKSDAPATDTAGAEAEPEKPAEPQKPRPSVFLRLVTQPVQDAMQANLESVTAGAGGLLPSP